ncbi:MAG: helix-turn-helix domain-containing protein [Firmicutes bacterium]|nr:helix-turn-helix domain-containing protein [Bacillota bacterium]
MAQRLHDVRRALGLTQQQLATQVGVSRQLISAIEAGRTQPSLDLALSIAATLHTSVETLFGNPLPSNVSWATQVDATPREMPVLCAQIDGHWWAYPAIESVHQEWADGLFVPKQNLQQGNLKWTETPPTTLVAAGCDPALGLLGKAFQRHFQVRWLFFNRGSEQALRALHTGQLHLAAVHDADAEELAVSSTIPAVTRIVLAHWPMGLAVAPGNPLYLRDIEALARPDLRIAIREPGSTARRWFDQQWALLSIDHNDQPRRFVVTSHRAVAEAVAAGLADAGLTTEAAARQAGCAFVPLVWQRCEVWIDRQKVNADHLSAIVDILQGTLFRHQLIALSGYDTVHTGEVL